MVLSGLTQECISPNLNFLHRKIKAMGHIETDSKIVKLITRE